MVETEFKFESIHLKATFYVKLKHLTVKTKKS